MVYLLWSNVNGEKESFGDKEEKWFTKMRQAMGGEEFCIDTPDLNSREFNGNQVDANFASNVSATAVPNIDLALPYEGK